MRIVVGWAIAAVAGLMRGWVLILPFVNPILADAIVWFAIAQGWPCSKTRRNILRESLDTVLTSCRIRVFPLFVSGAHR